MKRNLLLLVIAIVFSSSLAFGAIVEQTIDFGTVLFPGEYFTDIVCFIPDLDYDLDIISAPVWPEEGDFGSFTDYQTLVPGITHPDQYWETGLLDSKTAYIHGPEAGNPGPATAFLFKFFLTFEYDTEDPDIIPGFPVRLDFVLYNEQTVVAQSGIQWNQTDGELEDNPGGEGVPAGSPWGGENFYQDGSNPIPLPSSIALLSAGALMLRRRLHPAK